MNALERFLEEEIAAGSFPGGAALVGNSQRILAVARGGDAARVPAVEPLSVSTRFDLASLTKPFSGGGLFLEAVREGLDLRSSPGRFLSAWKSTRFDGVTIEHLLTHTSGLPAWFPLYVRGEGAAAYRATLGRLELETVPGAAVVYSDLGVLVAGEVLETFFGAPIDRLFAELVAGPAGSGAGYPPPGASDCAATEADDETERRMTAELGLSYDRFRTGIVRGEVHDGNAFRRGGVSAHAGIFATVEDVWRLARPWLDPERRSFVADRTTTLPEARGLLWQGARGARSLSESAEPPDGFSIRTFGHTGFTGTSVWIDPESERIFVLLTNRVHPRAAGDFNAVRRRFHAAVGREEW